jgi:hypothetical protein
LKDLKKANKITKVGRGLIGEEEWNQYSGFKF